jgi:uncharacterized RDD family membrane protein YckC
MALAGPTLRVAAYLLDLAIIILLNIGLVLLFGLATQFMDDDIVIALMFVAMFVVNHAYFIIYEYASKGRTLGKSAAGLRVLRANGTRIGFHEAFMRNVLRFLDGQPALFLLGPCFYLLGFAFCALHPKHMRLGDMVAGTIVVHERRVRLPGFPMAYNPSANSLRADPALVWRITTTITMSEKEALVELLDRANGMDAANRLRVFDEYARHFQRRFGITEDLSASSERFVVNVSDIAFAKD